MVIHGAWDGVAGLGDGSTLAVFPIMPVILGGGIALFFAVYRMTAAREKGWLRDVMAPEVERGHRMSPPSRTRPGSAGAK